MDYAKLKKRWLSDKLGRRKISEGLRSEVISKGMPLFIKFGVKKVVLFGSVVDGRAGEASDIDILVLPLPNDQYWQCRHELEQAVNYPIDLYTQDDDQKFVSKILARGEVIYEV
jgi:predicted nucleotidyltransferase